MRNATDSHSATGDDLHADRRRTWIPVSAGILTSLLVLAGIAFGNQFIPLLTRHPSAARRVDFASSLANWDGEWYCRIACEGYSYQPGHMSSVVFFPLYPAVGSVLMRLTGMRAELALTLISNCFLIASFVVLARYVQRRFPEASPDLPLLVILAIGLYPASLFFHVAYSESMLLFALILAMDLMERRAPSWLVALAIGMASGVRPVGVALIVPFGLDLWQRRQSTASFAVRAAVLTPVCAWGLIAFMLYLSARFDDPLAFVHNQSVWIIQPPPSDWSTRVLQLASWEPIRDVYDPSTPSYWASYPPSESPFFNVHFANPILLAVTFALVVAGALTRSLNARETLLGLLLLAIPYVLKAQSSCMMSQGRYTSVVFPAFLVLGLLMNKAPRAIVIPLLALAGALLAAWSALFASWYWVL